MTTMANNSEQLEHLSQELMRTFGIHAPPVPIETMLQSPPKGMWAEVDPMQLSGSFISISHRFSPRISIARMLVRHIIDSPWGATNNLSGLISTPEEVTQFARMLLMPKDMIMSLTKRSQNPTAISMQFEVPEDDASARLIELTL